MRGNLRRAPPPPSVIFGTDGMTDRRNFWPSLVAMRERPWRSRFVVAPRFASEMVTGVRALTRPFFSSTGTMTSSVLPGLKPTA